MWQCGTCACCSCYLRSIRWAGVGFGIPQDPQARVHNVPVDEGAQNVAHIAVRVVVPGTSVDQAQIVEREHVAGRGLESAGVLVGQAHKGGHRLVPRTHLLHRHAKVAVALRNAVVDAHTPALRVQAARDRNVSQVLFNYAFPLVNKLLPPPKNI